MMNRQKVSFLTEKGVEKAEKAFSIDNLFDLEPCHASSWH